MSDEEKKAISILKQRDRDFDELYTTYRQSFIKPYDKSIGIILNLIEKQSKEIEELKEERKKYPIAMNDEQYKKVIELVQKDIKEELDRQINIMINEEYIEKNYVSKDKIKAKIEEIKNECKYCDFTDEFCQELLQNNNCTQGNTLKVLQSLLEKE